jgi:hypothetical protein
MAMINTTGVWTECNYGQAARFASAESAEEKICISDKERNILRNLASKVLELSSTEINDKKRKHWYGHNSLSIKKPVIFCDPENGWNEIITGEALKCNNKIARRWEVVLLKELFYDRLKDDKPTEPYFDIAYTFTDSDWGSQEIIRGGKNGGSYVWEGQIKRLEDLKVLHFPAITVDHKTTLEAFETACEVFEGILKVRLRGYWWWGFGLTYELVRLVGLENMLIYLYDKPDLIHKIMGILRDGSMAKLDYLEKNNLLDLNNDISYVGSGGLGYSDELPKRNLECSNVKTIDMWGFAESQETGSVSPMMFEEFVFQYQHPILKRFGMNCYGCCEPLDKRWNIIKNTPNLRRVSVSPWADLEKMSQYLGDKYILSYKPIPSDLAVPSIDKENIRKKIRNALEITKGCVVEIIMKDNHTIGRNPQNLIDWVKIAREEIDRIYG